MSQREMEDLEVRQDEEVLPPYSELGEVSLSQDGFSTQAHVADDGRVDIRINEKLGRLSNLFAPALRSQLAAHEAGADVPPLEDLPPYLESAPSRSPPPPLNIVIHVVGSRGDVQPFVALGQTFQKIYHHRVRLATHLVFKDFVERNGLEFFSIGGDPAELMAFMVKNPGLIPGMKSIRSGDIGRRRKGMAEIMQNCYRSCYETGDGTENDNASQRPFVADAIIANPPSFAHIHCAEKLGVPLHLMFTMPWSPTQAFPHPIANVKSSNASGGMTNVMSYALVEMMTWQGLGDIINRFREKTLGLGTLSQIAAAGMVNRLKIPYTYCWSPALIPQPKDWGHHISISGFYFLSLALNYTAEPDLAAFLAAGPPPVYIGFGSIVVDDPDAMTKLIFQAVAKTGQRALVSKGWGGFGGDEVPQNVFMLGNVPHDWLFQRVSCVVHHGGAGTTAAGIAAGRPTVIVPFFGDQPFWGSMVARAGAGPEPIPHKQLTAENLALAILDALSPTALDRARELGESIQHEKGCEMGAESFHAQMGVDALRCSLLPERVAIWHLKGSKIRLSSLAATVLGNEGLIKFNDLRLFRSREYGTEMGPSDPLSGAAFAALGSVASLTAASLNLPIGVVKEIVERRLERPVLTQSSGSTSSIRRKPLATPLSNSIVGSSEDDANLRSASGSRVSPTGFRTPGTASRTLSNQDLYSEPGTFGTDSDLTETSTLQSGSSELSVGSALTPGSTTNSRRNEKKPSSKSFAQGFYQEVSGSHYRSQPGARRRSAQPEVDEDDDIGGTLASDAAVGAGKGIGRLAELSIKTPLDITVGIAKGFHNAPKLYGDDTVREHDKVTGYQSGLLASGKGLGLGLFDGFTGLVTQPIRGAKKEGLTGFVKGLGKGVGGFLIKPAAAGMAIPAYAFQGVYEEVQKHFGSGTHSYILAARYAQGHEDFVTSTQEQRSEVLERWHTREREPPSLMARWQSAQEWWKTGKLPTVEADRRGSTPAYAPSVGQPVELDAGIASPGSGPSYEASGVPTAVYELPESGQMSGVVSRDQYQSPGQITGVIGGRQSSPGVQSLGVVSRDTSSEARPDLPPRRPSELPVEGDTSSNTNA